MLRCRLTLKWTTSPFFLVRTSWASPPSQARSSDAYSAMPSSRVSRSPERTFSSSSRLSPTSMPYLFLLLCETDSANRTPTPLHLFRQLPDPVLPLRGQHDGRTGPGDALGAGQPPDDPLQTVDVGGPPLEHERVVARDEPAVLELGEVLHPLGHVLVVGGVGER